MNSSRELPGLCIMNTLMFIQQIKGTSNWIKYESIWQTIILLEGRLSGVFLTFKLRALLLGRQPEFLLLSRASGRLQTVFGTRVCPKLWDFWERLALLLVLPPSEKIFSQAFILLGCPLLPILLLLDVSDETDRRTCWSALVRSQACNCMTSLYHFHTTWTVRAPSCRILGAVVWWDTLSAG